MRKPSGRVGARSRLSILGIAAEGRHGANPGERDRPQRFVVDVEVAVAVTGDSMDQTADYRAIVDQARNTVAHTSFQLLESLAAAIARAVCGLPGVIAATARVHKPAAAASLRVTDVWAESTVTT